MVMVRPKSQGARKFTKNLQRKGRGSLRVTGKEDGAEAVLQSLLKLASGPSQSFS